MKMCDVDAVYIYLKHSSEARMRQVIRDPTSKEVTVIFSPHPATAFEYVWEKWKLKLITPEKIQELT